MSISADKTAKILRYYHVEKWRIWTIACEVGVHHSTVKRVIANTGAPKSDVMPKPSMIDPYLPFVLSTLEKHPKLTAKRLYDMVCERGYPGGYDHFRHMISLHRPKRHAEAYLRLKTLPGEQAQVDWGHFGHIMIGKAKRPVVAFVMVLSYSRKIFLRFYLGMQMSNFLRGHEAAFQAWGGVPRVLLYDNLKSAVLERHGDAIRFNPTLLEFAAHYRYEPRPVAIARGNEKGRVERSIRYIRDNFFAAREWEGIENLNDQAEQWCDNQASNRPCPEDKSQSVRSVYDHEKTKLIALPDNPYPTHEQEEVKVGKTAYVRFDKNDYSVPHTYVNQKLCVIGLPNIVKIVDGSTVVAEHPRSYGKAEQIEQECHVSDLVEKKKHAKHHRTQNRLIMVAPSASKFLEKAIEHGYYISTVVRELSRLLNDYGADELETGIAEALSQEVPHPNTVRICLEERRETRNQPPPIHLDLPNDDRINKQIVRPHNLNAYDQLATTTKEAHHDK